MHTLYKADAPPTILLLSFFRGRVGYGVWYGLILLEEQESRRGTSTDASF